MCGYLPIHIIVRIAADQPAGNIVHQHQSASPIRRSEGNAHLLEVEWQFTRARLDNATVAPVHRPRSAMLVLAPHQVVLDGHCVGGHGGFQGGHTLPEQGVFGAVFRIEELWLAEVQVIVHQGGEWFLCVNTCW